MTKGKQTALWLIGISVLILWLAVLSLSPSHAPVAQTGGGTIPFKPVMPKIKQLGIHPTDPHYCMKPDDAQFRGLENTAVCGGCRQFHDPSFLFDVKYQLDSHVTWANNFTGTVPVCLVVDEKGEPGNFTFPASPGKDIEDHIKDMISGWRWKPGWYQEGYADHEHHVIKTQMAYDIAFPE